MSQCLANTVKEIGRTSTMFATIKLTSNVPISCVPRQYPETERREIREILIQLLKHKIIQESKLPYAFHVLLGKKKTGERDYALATAL
jgi:hypothetical protein